MTDASIMPPPPKMSDLLDPARTPDRSAEFDALSKQTSRDPAAEREFIANRLQLMKTHPSLDQAGREAAVADFARRVGPAADFKLTSRGSVGFGMWFNNYPWQIGWTNGTAIRHAYICPTLPGSNITTLYLTACNRAGKCVEALVSYRGQQAKFEVFDWARPENSHWQTSLRFDQLSDFLFQTVQHGQSYQCLSLLNMTSRVMGLMWRNSVLLFNFKRSVYEKIYTYEYTATDNEQKNSSLSWGPIIETFQPSYRNMQAMGAVDTQLNGADKDNNWTAWKNLTPDESYLQDSQVGFRKVFLDPNYSWAADAPA